MLDRKKVTSTPVVPLLPLDLSCLPEVKVIMTSTPALCRVATATPAMPPPLESNLDVEIPVSIDCRRDESC